jgi:hypothetical protein
MRLSRKQNILVIKAEHDLLGTEGRGEEGGGRREK